MIDVVRQDIRAGLLMEKSDHCIHPARKSVKPPKRIVDQNGKAVFGTFESEFETLNLLDLKHPTAAPDLFNRLRLTLWEAMEVNLKEGVLLAAICDMGLFGKILNVFWDRRTNRIYRFEKSISSSETGIAPCLIGRTIALARTDSSEIRYVNEFEHGRASVTGRHRENHDELEYDFQLEKICEPSIVSIPFGKNRPLYSEKVLFKVKGSITVNGEKMTADEHTTAIIDDHRGYYPRKMHYDWVTSMGLTDNGYLGVNLARLLHLDVSLLTSSREPPIFCPFVRGNCSTAFFGSGKLIYTLLYVRGNCSTA
ncbi:MAG: DUF2804 family protein [Erysipelotrichia bacterium]|nr:DUF2804 family protein [Erysipelotrichia bacterium]